MHAVTGQVLRTTVRWARGYSQVPERASSAGIKLASLIGGGALTWYVGYKTGEHDGFWKG